MNADKESIQEWIVDLAATGEPIAKHVREDKDGSKEYFWTDLNGSPRLPDGVKLTDLSLYLIKFCKKSEPVILVEGEKCADSLHELGINVAATVCGAGSIPGDDALRRLLEFPEVLLWADNDDVGKRHMDRIADKLIQLGGHSIKEILWNDAPKKGDCVDAIEREVDVSMLIKDAQMHKIFHSEKIESHIRFYSAVELQTKESQLIEYVCKPWVVAGSITELSGKIKLAGKTTFVTNLCSAVTKGEAFLGHLTAQRPVIYMTEQPKPSFREALRRARLTEQKNFYAVFHNETRENSWSELVNQVVDKAIESNALIVIDTLPQFASIKGDGENNTGEALSAMEPLQVASSKGLGVIVIRHERKSGGDLGDSARGSSAFGGAVDTVVSIRRGDGNTDPSVRVISGVSRFDGIPSELYVELTETGYVSLGTSGAVAESKARSLILENAPVSEEEAMSLDDFTEGLDIVKKTTASKVLRQLVDEGKLRCRGTGKKGNPYRYWKVIHSFASKREDVNE